MDSSDRPDRSSAMVAAAMARHEETQRRTIETLRRMDELGEPVNFAAVARAADVSRAWLYREPAVRAEIDRLRTTQARSPQSRLPVAQRTSEPSLARRFDALRAELVTAREENRRLREALARRLGERRAGEAVRGG